MIDKLNDIWEKAKEFRKEHIVGCVIADGTAIIGIFTLGLCIYGTKRVKKLVRDESAVRDMIGYANVLTKLEDTSVDIYDLKDLSDKIIGHAVLNAGALNSLDSQTIAFDTKDGCGLLYECIGD